MQFVEPILMWGVAAVVIPVVIHFWHQKQGQPLPWAATQWLTEKDQQQSRGLRLDNILLLIIRCLLLVLLALLLAQPLLDWLSKPKPIQRVHLVQPSRLLAANFRFELEEAGRKGEPVFWATASPKPFETQSQQPQSTPSANVLTLQTAINTFDQQNTDLHLYVVNDQALADVPALTVPARFHLHNVVDTTRQPRAYLAVSNSKKLFVNWVGRLTSSATLDAGLKFRGEPAHSGRVRVLLNYQNPRERQTVRAALAALVDVYALDLIIDEKPVSKQSYDWVLTDQYPVPNQSSGQFSRTYYVVSGPSQPTAGSNVYFANETLTPQTSDRVANGQLPEWLGQGLLRHYGLETIHQPLSQHALNTLFVPSTRRDTTQQASLQQAILLAFTVLVVLERWLALTRNA